MVEGLNKIATIKPKDTRLEAESYKKLIVQYSTDPRVTVLKIADRLAAEGIPAEAPYNGAVYELTGGAVALLRQGTMVPMAKASQPADKPRTSPAFERLLNMGKRLLVVIEHNRGGANKDLARFASQIASLCDKWDR